MLINQVNVMSNSTKQKFLAGTIGLLMLGSSAIGAEKKKTLDNIVEPTAKVEVAQPKNLSFGGVKLYNDSYGNVSGEFDFGTFYADKKIGFLGGLTVDIPRHKRVSSHITDMQFRDYDWSRMGLMLSGALLKGKPSKYLIGPEVGVGIQNTRLHYDDIILGKGSIGESDEEKNSLFYKLGALLMVHIKGNFYLTINAGAKGGVSHITLHGMDNRLEQSHGITPYAGVGFAMSNFPWKIGAPE